MTTPTPAHTAAPSPVRLPVSFTFDLEDHTHAYAPGGRYVDNTRRLLDWLDARGIRGTFFTLGRVAQSQPALVRDIARRGHELACHSLAHRPLPTLTPQTFAQDTQAAKAALEDAAGGAVKGYRAPYFSLDARALWAPEVLAGLGFAYSSSVMPATPGALGRAFKPHHLVGAPRVPYRWPSGLVELPVPQSGLGPLTLPYLGGIYLRYLPLPVLTRMVRRRPPGQLAWSYLHPYDYDTTEPFAWHLHGSAAYSVLLWLRRGGTLARLDRVLNGEGHPLGDYLTRPELTPLLGELPIWPPHLAAGVK